MLVAGCHTVEPPPAAPQIARVEPLPASIIELIIPRGGDPLPADATMRAVRDAAVIFQAVTDYQVDIREQPSRRVAVVQCRLEWRPGFEIDLMLAGRVSRDPCRIQIKTGLMGVNTEDALRCAVLHEMLHLVLPPGWHSEHRDSVMHESISPACRVTADVVSALY